MGITSKSNLVAVDYDIIQSNLTTSRSSPTAVREAQEAYVYFRHLALLEAEN